MKAVVEDHKFKASLGCRAHLKSKGTLNTKQRGGGGKIDEIANGETGNTELQSGYRREHVFMG